MAGVKNKLANKANTSVEQTNKKRMKDWIVAMKPQIEAALPSVITAERFTRMTLTALSTTPQLANCTPESFMGAMMQAAQLGLEPNTPLAQAYLIPYRNKGELECQFQMGYKGLIDLAHRSGEFKNIEARVVYENDDFEYEYGLEPKLYHKPAMKNRGEVVCYYAVYNLVNGGFGFEVMSKEDVEKHAKTYSQAYNSGYSPWTKNFDEMAKKTLIKRALKYAPIKTEFAREVAADNTIKTELSEDMSLVADETIYETEGYEVTEDGEIIEDITAEEMAEIMAAEQQEMGL